MVGLASSKVQAAKSIMDSLRRKHNSIVSSYTLVCDAMMYLNSPDTDMRRGRSAAHHAKPPSELPKVYVRKFMRLLEPIDLTKVPVLTVDIPATPGSSSEAYCAINVATAGSTDFRLYDKVPRITRYDQKIAISASGLTRPKFLRCIGSDGQTYHQLTKMDDVKPDAIMQQVFTFVNDLLAHASPNDEDSGTASSSSHANSSSPLHIRTYKVMPLAPRAGLMEVVRSSTSLSDYLHKGKNCAFSRYAAKSEWNYSICFHKMRAAEKLSHAEKLALFAQVCANHKPQFRHFFQETFPNACDWFQRRENYARSVAVNSIAGFILGIGDRHCENILLDLRSGELVHIDFGYVFDQGLLLRVPETVPFRLTRNIVDGLGILGTEGTFRHCCEQALTVLRQNTDNLFMILEVIVHDPLFAWTRTVPQLLQRQDAHHREGARSTASVADSTQSTDVTDLSGDASNTNDCTEDQGVSTGDKETDKDVSRVLLRIRQKLRGQAHATAEPLGVTGQVRPANIVMPLLYACVLVVSRDTELL